MEYGPPPLFNQGVSARARLAFFSLAAAALIIVDRQVNALDSVRNGVETILYPVQRVLLWPRDLVVDVAGYFQTIGSLNEENEHLRRQMVEQSERAQQADQLQKENDQLRSLAGVKERLAVPSQVVVELYESRDSFSNKIVIDRGSHDGMKPGGPVIDESGVVGQVTRVFPNSSEVTLLTDKEQSLPVQVVRNGLHAVAFGGQERGTLELKFLPANVDVQGGDQVVTSGLDGVYPAGMAVATVTRVDRDLKDQFARVVLKPAAGLSESRLLLVLMTKPPPLPLPEAEQRKPANERPNSKAVRR
jgi:rod shape-determining protein MreC